MNSNFRLIGEDDDFDILPRPELVRLRALEAENERLWAALQACWDEYEEVMPDPLFEQVKDALGLLVFTASLPRQREEHTDD